MTVHPTSDELLTCYEEINVALPWLTGEGLRRLAVAHAEKWNDGIRFWQLSKEKPGLLAEIASPAGLARGESAINEMMIVAAQLFHFANQQRQCAQNMSNWKVDGSFPVLLKTGFNCCHAAMLRHNEIVPVSEFLAFPLQDCGSLVCRCRIVMLRKPKYDRFK